MAQVRFFTDEDVYGVIAIALRKADGTRCQRPKPAAWARRTSRSYSGRPTNGESWSRLTSLTLRASTPNG